MKCYENETRFQQPGATVINLAHFPRMTDLTNLVNFLCVYIVVFLTIMSDRESMRENPHEEE